jgi:glycosyltransferase involved in cell wall biosynthesis
MKKIAVLIPCFNEEKGISQVLSGFPREFLSKIGYELDIIVIDNNSTDRTALVALKNGARVIHEPKKGKGYAFQAGINEIWPNTDYVVMLDGDNTYKSKEIYRLIEPLENNFCDVIIGSRLGGKIIKKSMKFPNRVGNWIFSFIIRTCYVANVTDVLTGYFAWKYEVIELLKNNISANDFRLEMELITKMARMRFNIYSVPITYDERIGESSLSIAKDGGKILFELIKNIFWKPNHDDENNKKFSIENIVNFESN